MANAKLKTVKGVAARFKVTGSGRIIGHRAGRRHLLHGKRAKLKRHLRRKAVLFASDARKVKALMPYSR